MRWFKLLLSAAISLLLIWALNRPWGTMPFAIGEFINPFTGFWQNAEPANLQAGGQLSIPGLKAPVTVVYDNRRVPHIFAQNNDDLYFAQGYVMARDRLWQMEFQILGASGRLTEILGVGPDSSILKFDRTNRRKGLVYAAERSYEFAQNYPEVMDAAEAYANGVNAWISSLKPADLPLEYKILNYKPQPWTSFNTWILQKYLSNMLAARADDIRNTNALMVWGRNVFDILYPEFAYAEDPIVPADTRWDARTANPKPPVPAEYKPDSILKKPASAFLPQPDPGLGSNNWAVAGSKSVTGNPILSNDPHLGLSLPSIWYEMQLHAPGVNAYGVGFPGGPGVVLGFNDSVAWGSTNAGMDVMDYYRVISDEKEEKYFFDGEWRPFTLRLETHTIKGGEAFVDSVKYTHYGPVIFDENFGSQPLPLAINWMAHEQSVDMLFFLKMNRAKNYHDYEEALKYWVCPAQNFVFASRAGDIAIWQMGKYVNKWPQQGRFVMDGTQSVYQWSSFIPSDQQPHSLNPERGFVSSANQHPTSSVYPYYYNGGFEDFRNRRLNQLLSEKEKYGVDDMKNIQLDNYAVFVADILPLMMQEVDTSGFTQMQREAWNLLKAWDYNYDRDQAAPTIFENWWEELYRNIWQDEMDAVGLPVPWPDRSTTIGILRDSAAFTFYKDATDSLKKDRKSLINRSFDRITGKLANDFPSISEWIWSRHKQTDIHHLARVFAPFSRLNIPTNGSGHILNATGNRNGPSWRMVVALGDKVEAWGVYPGGQTGNPGSKDYDAFIDDWANGKYYRIWFMNNKDQDNGSEAARLSMIPEVKTNPN
ncbi:MAG: penicillin acylase family protein [Bacteroidia bacterium]